MPEPIVNDAAAAAIEERVDEMCRKLLANPVIERYRYEVSEEPAS